MNFANVTSITIPEGSVSRILKGSEVLWEKVTSLLPKEYQQLEYIGTDGLQIIDTLVIPSEHRAGILYELDFRSNWTTSLNSNDYVWGCISGTSRSGNLAINRGAGNFRLICGTSTSYLICHWYALTNRCVARAFATSENAASKTLEFERDGVITPASINNSSSVNATMPDESIYLFNCRGIDRQGTPVVCYGFRMTDADGTPVRDYVPCRHRTSNEIGMYDTVEGKFYTNIGTGTFTAGPEV